MLEVPNKVVVDCTTGQASIVELTQEEVNQREIDAIELAQHQLQRESEMTAKAAAKASAEAKLAALGLTPEEIAALR